MQALDAKVSRAFFWRAPLEHDAASGRHEHAKDGEPGGGRENFDKIAERSLTYRPVHKIPRPIRTSADVKEILELAW